MAGPVSINDILNAVYDNTLGLLKVSLQAGTASIGKLAANDGVDIGDVDIATIAAGETHIGEIGGR